MSSTAFEVQKAIGDLAENRVMQAFISAGLSVRRRQWNARNDLEVVFPYGTEIIEVKNEDRYEESSNLCVETYQGLHVRKPSGIKTSESTYCVHTLGEECIVYRTQPMRLHIEAGLQGHLYTEGPFGKADNGNGGVLVNKLVVLWKSWCDQITIAKLPFSKVFKSDNKG